MMDATKLIEAATYFNDRPSCECDPESGVTNCMGCDIGMMATHILSTVRPDDDEPVTVEKMATEPGWRCDQLIHGVQQYLHVNGFSVVCDNGVFRFRGTVLQTMRKVRLVAALGE